MVGGVGLTWVVRGLRVINFGSRDTLWENQTSIEEKKIKGFYKNSHRIERVRVNRGRLATIYSR